MNSQLYAATSEVLSCDASEVAPVAAKESFA